MEKLELLGEAAVEARVGPKEVFNVVLVAGQDDEHFGLGGWVGWVGVTVGRVMCVAQGKGKGV